MQLHLTTIITLCCVIVLYILFPKLYFVKKKIRKKQLLISSTIESMNVIMNIIKKQHMNILYSNRIIHIYSQNIIENNKNNHSYILFLK